MRENEYNNAAEYAQRCITEKDLNLMHFWLPSEATQDQIDLVNEIIGDDTGRYYRHTR